MNSGQTSRQLEQDRAHVARGLDVHVPDGRQVAALMRVLYNLVQASVEGGSVSPLMEWMHDNYAVASNAFEGDFAIACRRGCAHCCHAWVDASPAEILYIAKSLSGSAHERAAKAVGQAAAITESMSTPERAAFVYPCPMLGAAGECSIYAVRPIVCRSAVSMDAAVCERAYNLKSEEEIQAPAVYVLAGRGYRLALAGALKRAGLTHRQVELNSALNIALLDSETERRWLGGEDPFHSACRAPEDDILADANYRQIYETAFADS